MEKCKAPYQSMVCHMCAVIPATAAEPLRYNANGRQPKIARKMQRGTSTIRAIVNEVNAGFTTAVKCRRDIFGLRLSTPISRLQRPQA